MHDVVGVHSGDEPTLGKLDASIQAFGKPSEALSLTQTPSAVGVRPCNLRRTVNRPVVCKDYLIVRPVEVRRRIERSASSEVACALRADRDDTYKGRHWTFPAAAVLS